MTKKDNTSIQSQLSRRIWRYSLSPGVIRAGRTKNMPANLAGLGIHRRSFTADIFRRWISPDQSSLGRNYSMPFVSPLFSARSPEQPLNFLQVVNGPDEGNKPQKIKSDENTIQIKINKLSKEGLNDLKIRKVTAKPSVQSTKTPQAVSRSVDGNKSQKIKSIENSVQRKINKPSEKGSNDIERGKLPTKLQKLTKSSAGDARVVKSTSDDLMPSLLKDKPVLQKKQRVNKIDLKPDAQLVKPQTILDKSAPSKNNSNKDVEDIGLKLSLAVGGERVAENLSSVKTIAVKESPPQKSGVEKIYKKSQKSVQAGNKTDISNNDTKTQAVLKSTDPRARITKSSRELDSESSERFDKLNNESENDGQKVTVFSNSAGFSSKIQKQRLDLTPPQKAQPLGNSLIHNRLEPSLSGTTRGGEQKTILIGEDQINRKEILDRKTSTPNTFETYPKNNIDSVGRINLERQSLSNPSLTMISRKPDQSFRAKGDNSRPEGLQFNDRFVPLILSKPSTEIVYRQADENSIAGLNQAAKSESENPTSNEGSEEDEKAQVSKKDNGNGDVDELADKVARKLMRQLEVEKERKGLRKWH